MKKIVSLLLVVALCCCTMLSAFASEFVPSISYKDHPEVDSKIDLVEDAGKTVADMDVDCVEIVAVSDAIDTPEAQRTDVQKQLAELYSKIADGSMKLPFDASMGDMVVRDLIDVSLICGKNHTHEEELEKDGVSIRLTFDLGVSKDTEVVVMTYKNDKWNNVESVTNNGDGSVTVVFEHLCPVAFCVEADAAEPPHTGDVNGAQLGLWTALLVCSLGAVVTMLVYPHRKRK